MKINTVKMKKLLAHLEPAVLKSDEIPVLKTILVANDYAVAYNTIIGCYVSTSLFGLEPLCISFMKLKAFINGTSTDEIDFSIDDGILSLIAGKSKARIPVEDACDFPNFDDLVEKASKGFSVTDDFSNGLKACLPFTARRTSRVVLQGVNISSGKAQSTDGIRIGQYVFDELPECNATIPFELCKALKGSDLLYFDSERVAIKKEDVLYFGGLIIGDFPDVEKYLPTVKKYVRFPNKEMRIALKKVGDFSEEGLENAQCEISFEDGIEIRYEGNVAQVEEYFDFGGKLPHQKFKLNPYHFEKILSYCDRFAFVEKDTFSLLYAISDNGKFKCLLSLEKA